MCLNPECMEMDSAYSTSMIWGSKKFSLLLQQNILVVTCLLQIF